MNIGVRVGRTEGERRAGERGSGIKVKRERGREGERGGERGREGERERGRGVYRGALELPIANGLAIINRFLSFSDAALCVCVCVCVCVFVCVYV